MATPISSAPSLDTLQSARGHAGQTSTFDQIHEPGCYVSRSHGALLRIPADALQEGRSLTFEVVAQQPWLVTKISDDPYMSINKARMAAADMDLPVRF